MVQSATSKKSERAVSMVGVYVESDLITLVRTTKGFVKKFAQYARDDYDTFAEALGHALDAFGVLSAGDHLWAATDFEGCLIRNIRLPKGPQNMLGPAIQLAIKKELAIDTKDLLVDYDVERDFVLDGHPQWSITALSVPRSEVESFALAFRQAGYRLDGVSLPYFAGLNFIRRRRVEAETGRSVFLSVGKRTSLIALLDEDGVRASREIHIGSDTFEESVRSSHKGALDSNQIWSFLSGEATLPPTADGSSMQEPPEKWVSAPARRLLRQIESTISSDPIAAEHAKADLLVAGPLAHCPALLAFLGKKVGMEPVVFNPIARNVVGKDVELPARPFENWRYFVATGLSLSDEERIPNLLVPKSLKDERRGQRRFNTVVALATVGGLVGIGIGAFFMSGRIQHLKQQSRSLQEKVVTLPPEATVEQLEQMTAQVVTHFTVARDLVNRNLPGALIGELAGITSDSIKLTEAQLSMALPKALESVKNNARSRSEGDLLILKGRVHADAQVQGTQLAEYMVRIEESVFFEEAKLMFSEKEFFGDEPVMKFDLKVRLSPLRKVDLTQGGAL
ncbi:MAG: Tfp pilus assembly PilM family ATPase [Kiritimatiellia bacterium]|jgi:Tfp pilus assembly PilM family ATPase